MNIFVSLPYTHKEPEIIQLRYERACAYSAVLLKQGHIPLSPIVTGHAILTVADLPGDFEFWKNYCYETLKLCQEVHVLQMPGWDQSSGVAAELEFAESKGMPVRYISYLDFIETP